MCEMYCNVFLALKKMGDEFLIGYIQAMDGEKDPRCLLVAFKSMEIISRNFNISK